MESGAPHAIEEVLARTRVPGASAALVEEGEVAWVDGFGVRRERGDDPVTADTIFAVASLSKPPFAYTVLRLCELGVLDLDTPLAALDPRPYSAYGLDPDLPELKRVTARHVLSHTSGLGNWQEHDRGRITSAPGSRWRYSGEGYLYLQTVVQHLTGAPLEELAAREVFGPLEMSSTGYVWRPEEAPRFANGHGESSTRGHEFTTAFAAFSLHATAGDYARFVAETMRSRLGQAMLVRQVAIDDSLAWGLGWGLAGDVFWHWGDVGDFQCAAAASRTERRGLVCLTNGEHGLEACAELLDAVLGAKFAHPICAVLERGW
jgi:CubicO group peptidase (beta-lactamase class C family)